MWPSSSYILRKKIQNYIKITANKAWEKEYYKIGIAKLIDKKAANTFFESTSELLICGFGVGFLPFNISKIVENCNDR